MPATRARPPTRQNGTSAPSAAAADEVVVAGPAQHGGGVRRAAAEPAAVGDLLVDVHGGPPPGDARARATRLVPSVGHTVGVGPADA